jgi:pimeloyl-ACP methyl ester carboxylesterase
LKPCDDFQPGLTMSRPLDDAARAAAPGQFLDLPDGKVHYRWDGPEHGPVVVMIHGFSLHHIAFDYNVPALTRAGFRVLRMDNYGRGWSDRIRSPHDVELFDRQLSGVLDALGLAGPVALIGYSMGGAISIAFAARHPQRVAQLALIAPAGLPFARPTIARALQVPLLGELLMLGFGRNTTLKGVKLLFDQQPERGREYADNLAKVIDFSGYYDGLLSTLRHYPLNGLEAEWAELGRRQTPTLLLWGDHDRTVPFPGEAALSRLLPHAQLTLFAGEDHGIPMVIPDAVNDQLLRFLGPDVASLKPAAA